MKTAAKLVSALCLYATSVGYAADSGRQALVPLSERPQAPEFDLPDASGKRVRLADFLGAPVIVNFWATWCPPCRAEMPSMQRAWEKIGKEGIGIVAINVGEDAETIIRFTDEYGVEFPLPMDLESSVVQAWPVKGLPTTFVVDAEGRLAYRAEGELEWDDPRLLDLVRALVPPKQ